MLNKKVNVHDFSYIHIYFVIYVEYVNKYKVKSGKLKG